MNGPFRAKNVLNGPFMTRANRLPAGGQRTTFREPGGRLHPEDGALVELLQRAGPGVGARRADAGTDRVQQVFDAGASRVERHARGRDALLEQALAGAVEGVVRARAGADGALRR